MLLSPQVLSSSLRRCVSENSNKSYSKKGVYHGHIENAATIFGIPVGDDVSTDKNNDSRQSYYFHCKKNQQINDTNTQSHGFIGNKTTTTTLHLRTRFGTQKNYGHNKAGTDRPIVSKV